MEKDKLEKVAKSAAHDYDNPQFDSFDDYVNGFIDGAEWLIGQPLSERLSEEERDNIKSIYNHGIEHYNGYNEDLYSTAVVVIEILKNIFGEEMFENIE